MSISEKIISWSSMNSDLLFLLGSLSIFIFVISVFMMVLIISFLPEDYFKSENRNLISRKSMNNIKYESRYSCHKIINNYPWPILIDLHLHTTKSDGNLTPSQLIKFVDTTDLQVISITDHDNIYAYVTSTLYHQPLYTKKI